MVNLVGSPVVTDSVIDSVAAPRLDGSFRVATTVIDGQVYVYASGFLDDGVQVLRMDADGQLTPIGAVRASGPNPLAGPAELDVTEVGGRLYLIVTSTGDDAVMSFEIGTTGLRAGLLTRADAVQGGSPDHDLDHPDHVEAFDTAAGSFIAVAANDSNAVFIYQLSDTGQMTLIDSAGAAGGASDLTLHTIGARSFLYVSGETGDSIAVFEVADDGTLTEATGVSPVDPVGEPLKAATIGDAELLVNANSDGLFSVFALSDDGTPAFLSSYDAQANDGFTDLRRFEIVTIEGATFIFSVIGDGVGIYSLEEDGTITLVTTVASAADLRVATGLQHQEIDGRHFIVVNASDADAVTTIEIGAGDDLIFGSPGDDTILGFAGNDNLSGADGHDVILAGTGDDLIFPGFGSDTVNGGDGVDTVNYSNTWAVNVRLFGDRASGEGFRDSLVSIENIVGSTLDDLLSGDDGANVIDGEAGNDRILGLSGEDVLIGGAGADVLRGGRDNDLAQGGDDDDRIQGERGNDTLLGEAGEDFLFGGDGQDILNGGADDDRLSGGEHADVFVFDIGGGADTIIDWQEGLDQIDLTGFGLADLDAVLDIAVEIRNGVQLQFESGDSLQIGGWSLAELSEDDFILV